LVNTAYSVDFTSEIQITGKIRCNSFVSSYKADDENLSIGLIAPTEIAYLIQTFLSASAYTNQDAFVINAISNAESYMIDGTLTITANDSSQLIFELVPDFMIF